MEEEDKPWHVVPEKDLKRHTLSEKCWCGPYFDENNNLWVHSSLREERETACVH